MPRQPKSVTIYNELPQRLVEHFRCVVCGVIRTATPEPLQVHQVMPCEICGQNTDHERLDEAAQHPVQTIDLTPVGLKTPEGCERANKAIEAFNGSAHQVANVAYRLFNEYGDLITLWMNDHRANYAGRGDEEQADDMRELWEELRQAIEARTKAQEEFLRSIAGAPSAA